MESSHLMLMVLQMQLKEQANKNSELAIQLEETLRSKEEMSIDLKSMVEKSEIYEQDLTKLKMEVDALTLSDAESKDACEKLRQQEVKTIESTELYKTQYEQLLEEYNQYLEDLEAVQSKLKGLESLKSTYEEENSSLKELCDRHQSKADSLQEKVKQLESNNSSNNELESSLNETKQALVIEKDRTKLLEEKIKDRDTTVEELHVALQELKDNLNIIEKQDSETKEKDQIKQNDVNIIEQLQEENERLKHHLEQNKDAKLMTGESTDSATNMMVEVLNEKSRENSQLKKENERLMQNLREEQRRATSLKESVEEATSEKDEMTKAAVHKLSQIIKDKDIEIEALRDKSESLLTVLQSNADDSDKQKQQHKETAKMLAEKSNECSVLRSTLEEKNSHAHNKTVMDNSNEIVILKDRIHELEKKLNLANIKNEMIKESRQIDNQQMKFEVRKRFHSESFGVSNEKDDQANGLNKANAMNEAVDEQKVICELTNALRGKEENILEITKELKTKEESLLRSHEELRTNHHKIDNMELRLSEADKSLEYFRSEIDKSQLNIQALQEDKQHLLGDNDKLKLCLEEKGHDLEMACRNLQQLTDMLEEKSNNSESQQLERLQNLGAIQELQAKISEMSRERDTAKVGLGEKEREMVGLRKEVNSVIDKKKRLEQELERLKQHLVSIEESYTQEAIESEERERELRKKLQIVEENLRVSCSNSSDSSKAAQAKETSLETKLVELNQENIQMRNRLFSVEAEFAAQKRAMENLNLALEGFQHEKINDLKRAEMMFEAKLSDEKEKRNVLEKQIISLEQKVVSAGEGLAAAHRLGDQLEAKGKVIATLRQEIKVREDLLKKARQELEANAGKVDRYLVKNLVVGYVVADTSKKAEVLKIIATVLDFNEEERSKTGLGKGFASHGWLQSWFGGSSQAGSLGQTGVSHRRTTSGEVQAATGLDLGLAQAFVKFLETESKPKAPPLQLPTEMTSLDRSPSATDSRKSSGRSTPIAQNHRQMTPTSLNTLEGNGSSQGMPTFTANRSSSAILKNVLHEEHSVVTVPLRTLSAAGSVSREIDLPESNRPKLPTECSFTSEKGQTGISENQIETKGSDKNESNIQLK